MLLIHIKNTYLIIDIVQSRFQFMNVNELPLLFFSIVTQILKKFSLFINILSKKMTLDFFFYRIFSSHHEIKWYFSQFPQISTIAFEWYRWSRRENTDHANKLTLYLRPDGRFGCYMRSDYILPSFLLLILFFCYCFIDCLFFVLEVSGVFCIVVIIIF